MKYRAIIRVPDTGEDFYLLWIDNHDEAMDWAKNRIFQWNEHTQAAQIFSAPETEITATITTLATQKSTEKLFEAYSNEQLLAIGVPEISLKAIHAIENLNDLERIEKALPSDAFENLFFLADGANIDLLIHEIKAGTQSNEDELQSFNNKRSFVEVKDNDELLKEFINGDLRKWQIFLHPSQRHLVHGSFSGSIKVTGGGGTGKTVAALHRLKFLSENALKTSDQPILYTTFTRALTTNLSKTASQMGINSAHYQLLNIDAVVRSLSEQFGIISKDHRILDMGNAKSSLSLWQEVLELSVSEFDETFFNDEYQDVILYNNILQAEDYYKQSRLGRGKMLSRKQRIEVWKIIEKYVQKKKEEQWMDRAELFNAVANYCNQNNLRPYSFLIADEIQDFSNAELRCIRAFVANKANDLFLVGDPFQKIYDRKINFTSVGINIRGNKSKRLRINYRTTEEIKKLAIQTIKGETYDNFDGEVETLQGYVSLMHGEQPKYVLFDNKKEEMEAIHTFIRSCLDQAFHYNDITIACRTKESIKDVKTYLHNNSIPYFDLSNQTGKNEGIVLSTFHSLKGLEFKAVILADVHQRNLPLKPFDFDTWEKSKQEEHLRAERALLYVALTRAMQRVFITGIGKSSDWL